MKTSMGWLGVTIPRSWGSVEVLLLLALLLTFVTYTLRIRQSLRLKLPPGPHGVPIIGNLLQFPPLRPYPQFHKWARQYGEIFHLKLGPQHVVVLNTAEAADELLTNRAKDYASRVAPHVAQDIMSAGQRLVFMEHGKEWKIVRKAVQNATGPGSSKRLRYFQELEAVTLLHDLLMYVEKTPADANLALKQNRVAEDHWFSLIRRYNTSIVMNITYGKRAHKIFNNPHLHKIYDVMEQFTQVAQPGKYLADAFPILRKLPDRLAPWRAEGRTLHKWEMELWGGLLEEHKASLKSGQNSPDCLMSTYLRTRLDNGGIGYDDAPGCGVKDGGWMRDTLLAYTGATVLEAGSDTTSASMQSFLLFMLSHPEVAEKARKEIDEAVGVEGEEMRMPGWEDEERLPYVVACIKETLRRRPPAVMGVPHMADKDDVYNGYHIPKGSTVIGNVWAIHMDPARYPDPFAYHPDRFYEQGKQTAWGAGPSANGRDHYVFGWGRRYCQGAQIAEASLFIVCARLLWAFDFVPLVDKTTGMPIIPNINDEQGTWSEGFISLPRTFPVMFVPRSATKAKMMRGRYEEVQGEWEAAGFERDWR